jgi:hypothetical protein
VGLVSDHVAESQRLVAQQDEAGRLCGVRECEDRVGEVHHVHGLCARLVAADHGEGP